MKLEAAKSLAIALGKNPKDNPRAYAPTEHALHVLLSRVGYLEAGIEAIAEGLEAGGAELQAVDALRNLLWSE